VFNVLLTKDKHRKIVTETSYVINFAFTFSSYCYEKIYFANISTMIAKSQNEKYHINLNHAKDFLVFMFSIILSQLFIY